jgi:hypothetical protein
MPWAKAVWPAAEVAEREHQTIVAKALNALAAKVMKFLGIRATMATCRRDIYEIKTRPSGETHREELETFAECVARSVPNVDLC